MAPDANTEVTFQIYADDGWKTVNGSKEKRTDHATYKTKLKNAPCFAGHGLRPLPYPLPTGKFGCRMPTSSRRPRGSGGSTNLSWTAQPP